MDAAQLIRLSNIHHVFCLFYNNKKTYTDTPPRPLRLFLYANTMGFFFFFGHQILFSFLLFFFFFNYKVQWVVVRPALWIKARCQDQGHPPIRIQIK